MQGNWSKEEIDYLIKYGKDKSRKLLAIELNKKLSSIKYMCCKLKLCSNNKGGGKLWSDEDLNYLYNNYSNKTFNELENHLKRTKWAIATKANELSIYKENIKCFYNGVVSKNKKLYRCLEGCHSRCYNQNNKGYKNYGGRGIYVCDEWNFIISGRKNAVLSFIRWALENGWKNKLTIDRIDNDGPYAPWNCRWVTHITQATNRRKQKTSKYIGVHMCKSKNKWIASINLNGKVICIGHFTIEKKAAEAYNKYLLDHNINKKLNKIK